MKSCVACLSRDIAPKQVLKFPGDSLLTSRLPATNTLWLGQCLLMQRAHSPPKMLQQQRRFAHSTGGRAVPTSTTERDIRGRFPRHRKERKHFKKRCLQLLLVTAAPDDFMLGEGPARRLAKKYDSKRKSPQSPFSWSWALDGCYGTAQAMSAWIWDQQTATVSRRRD